jgi:drug/metabolite transporter (DMT)-like permease
MNARPALPAAPLQTGFAVTSLLYAATLWGLVWYPYRLLGEAGVGGVASSFLSYALPLLLVGWLHFREVAAARGRWGWLALMGLAAGWTNLAYVLAVLEGEVVRVLLLFYLSPLWTVVLARVLLKEKLNRAGAMVMLLAGGGALVMLWQPGELPLPANRAEWLALTAGMMFAVSNVVSRHLDGVSGGAKTVSVWAGVAMLTVIGLAIWPHELDFVPTASATTWGLIVLVAAAIASMTYAVQFGLAHVPANQAIVIFLFELVVGAVSAYLLTDERMDTKEWIGAAMIIVASLFSGRMQPDPSQAGQPQAAHKE